MDGSVDPLFADRDVQLFAVAGFCPRTIYVYSHHHWYDHRDEQGVIADLRFRRAASLPRASAS